MAREFTEPQYILSSGVWNTHANLGNNSWLSVWFYVTVATSAFRRVLASKMNGTNIGYELEISTSGKLKIDMGSGSPVSATGATTVPTDQWNHALMVRNNTAGTLTLYLNGASDGSSSVGAQDAGDGDVSLTIARSASEAGWYFHTGALAEIAGGNEVPDGPAIAALAAGDAPAIVSGLTPIFYYRLLGDDDPEPDEITAETGDLLPNGSGPPQFVPHPTINTGGGGGGSALRRKRLGFSPIGVRGVRVY